MVFMHYAWTSEDLLLLSFLQTSHIYRKTNSAAELNSFWFIQSYEDNALGLYFFYICPTCDILFSNSSEYIYRAVWCSHLTSRKKKLQYTNTLIKRSSILLNYVNDVWLLKTIAYLISCSTTVSPTDFHHLPDLHPLLWYFSELANMWI